ncbi:hypothetical protein F8388_003292 [Cannabis sativa]|uniref:Uncharacterized protein n=1 Tax=Cannabis sativa TaxID=3483 RepID=A0A7J6DWG0_CANSA|nr:hypothetical protein F8388_014948 [Cannabis sativa]KAF4351639.1 hypothetical protein F8388_003292 [Cannabis sativa]KAF4371322.1 hypothetical protein G4B88_003792 [Cannabis sativa]
MDTHGKDSNGCKDSPSVDSKAEKLLNGVDDDSDCNSLLPPRRGGMSRKSDKVRRKVQWNDRNGDKLAEVVEFEPSDVSDSEDEESDSCICIIIYILAGRFFQGIKTDKEEDKNVFPPCVTYLLIMSSFPVSFTTYLVSYPSNKSPKDSEKCSLSHTQLHNQPKPIIHETIRRSLKTKTQKNKSTKHKQSKPIILTPLLENKMSRKKFLKKGWNQQQFLAKEAWIGNRKAASVAAAINKKNLIVEIIECSPSFVA